MRRGTILLITLAEACVCRATTPAPFFKQTAILDRMFDATKTELPARYSAFEILVRVAGGTVDRAGPALESQFELKPGQLQEWEFKTPSVRAYALRRIGEVGLTEALQYLQSLTKSDLEPDSSAILWPTAQIALRQAQLIRISDERGKIRFLEDTTSEKSAAASWAVDELCERGSYGSLGFVRESIRKRNPTPRGEKEVAFCEARMSVVSRNPDRLKALGSFLSVTSGVTDDELVGWAISKLEGMKSPRADAELERYANEIDALPEDSPLKRELESKRARIRNLLPAPKK